MHLACIVTTVCQAWRDTTCKCFVTRISYAHGRWLESHAGYWMNRSECTAWFFQWWRYVTYVCRMDVCVCVAMSLSHVRRFLVCVVTRSLWQSCRGSASGGAWQCACLLILMGQSDDQIVLCRHVCVCVFMYKVYVYVIVLLILACSFHVYIPCLFFLHIEVALPQWLGWCHAGDCGQCAAFSSFYWYWMNRSECTAWFL